MNAAFFGLAVVATLNPKLLAVDLLGLLDVFVLQADAVKTQGSASAGLDLARAWRC